MTGFADAFAPLALRLTCPAPRRSGEGVCGRFIGEMVGTYLQPPPCPGCGARVIVRVSGGVPHYEILRGRRPSLTGVERSVDNPPEHT